MSTLKLICNTCFEVVAIVDTDKFFYPATGSMFKSPDTKHGLPDPFPPGATWEEWRCPYSGSPGHRISPGPDAVMLENRALYRIPTYEEVVSRRDVQAEIKEPEAPREDEPLTEEGELTETGSDINDEVKLDKEDIEEHIAKAAEEVKQEQQPVIKTPYDDPTGQEKNAMSEAPKPQKQQVVDDGTVCRICGNTFKTKAACASHRATVHKPGSEREVE